MIIQNQIRAITAVGAETPTLLGKIAAMGIMTAATVGLVAQAKSAQASIAGAREHGGGVQAGSLYQVAEKGKPEMFQDASGKYLLQPSTSGRVTPIADAGMGNKVINATFNIYGASDANVTGQTIVRLLKEVDRDGSMDWNGMTNLKRTVGA
jgi:SLT domain-containing protein